MVVAFLFVFVVVVVVSCGKFLALLMLWDRERRAQRKGRIVSPDPKETDGSGKIPDFLG